MERTMNTYKREFFNAALFEFIAFSIIIILCTFVFREKPPTPPSESANQVSESNLKEELKKIVSNKNVVLNGVVFAIILMTMNIMSANVAALIEPFGYDAVTLYN
jgi:Na+/melibiose symporter-like transporter